MIKRLNQKC